MKQKSKLSERDSRQRKPNDLQERLLSRLNERGSRLKRQNAPE